MVKIIFCEKTSYFVKNIIFCEKSVKNLVPSFKKCPILLALYQFSLPVPELFFKT